MMWDGVAGLRAAHAEGRILQAWKAGAGDRGAAPPARGDARRRRVRDRDSRGAVPLPARARTSAPARSRATSRRPSRAPRCWSSTPTPTSPPRAPLFKQGLGRALRRHDRVPAAAQGGRRSTPRRTRCKLRVPGRRERRRAQRAAADACRRHRRAGRPRHRQRALVRGRLPRLRIDRGQRHVHVLGDSIQTAPLMPKSGHMANAQAKVAAAAIVAALADWPVDPAPMLTNTCYSFVDDAPGDPRRQRARLRRGASRRSRRCPARAACRPSRARPRAATPGTGRATSGPTCWPER